MLQCSNSRFAQYFDEQRGDCCGHLALRRRRWRFRMTKFPPPPPPPPPPLSVGWHLPSGRRRTSPALPAATARDDITADLHRLSADVASLRDTVRPRSQRPWRQRSARRGPTLAMTSHLPRRTKQTPCCPNSVHSRALNPMGVVIGAFGNGMLIGLMKNRG